MSKFPKMTDTQYTVMCLVRTGISRAYLDGAKEAVAAQRFVWDDVMRITRTRASVADDDRIDLKLSKLGRDWLEHEQLRRNP